MNKKILYLVIPFFGLLLYFHPLKAESSARQAAELSYTADEEAEGEAPEDKKVTKSKKEKVVVGRGSAQKQTKQKIREEPKSRDAESSSGNTGDSMKGAKGAGGSKSSSPSSSGGSSASKPSKSAAIQSSPSKPAASKPSASVGRGSGSSSQKEKDLLDDLDPKDVGDSKTPIVSGGKSALKEDDEMNDEDSLDKEDSGEAEMDDGPIVSGGRSESNRDSSIGVSGGGKGSSTNLRDEDRDLNQEGADVDEGADDSGDDGADAGGGDDGGGDGGE